MIEATPRKRSLLSVFLLSFKVGKNATNIFEAYRSLQLKWRHTFSAISSVLEQHFCLQVLKFYPIRLSFIFFAFPNFNPGEHQSAQMTTTNKGPNMPHSKCHVSLWRPYILWKRLWLIWVIPLHQSVCQVLKNPKRMYQEWPSVVVVAQGRCLRPYVAGAEGLVFQHHYFR